MAVRLNKRCVFWSGQAVTPPTHGSLSRAGPRTESASHLGGMLSLWVTEA